VGLKGAISSTNPDDVSTAGVKRRGAQRVLGVEKMGAFWDTASEMTIQKVPPEFSHIFPS